MTAALFLANLRRGRASGASPLARPPTQQGTSPRRETEAAQSQAVFGDGAQGQPAGCFSNMGHAYRRYLATNSRDVTLDAPEAACLHHCSSTRWRWRATRNLRAGEHCSYPGGVCSRPLCGGATHQLPAKGRQPAPGTQSISQRVPCSRAIETLCGPCWRRRASLARVAVP